MSRISRFLFIFLVASGYFYYIRVTQYHQASHATNVSITQPITPENTVFAFDLNQVVIMADIPKIKEILCSIPKKELALFLFNPFNWACIIKIALEQRRAEYFFQALMHTYPQLIPYKHFYFDLFLAVNLNNEAVMLIQYLKSLDYTCYAFSDMGPKALEALMEKFPTLRELFDNDTFIPPCCDKKMVKRYPEFHETFKAYVAQKNGSKQIIFIDNYEPNIIAARKAGIYSLLFMSTDILIQQLRMIGVLPKEDTLANKALA